MSNVTTFFRIYHDGNLRLETADHGAAERLYQELFDADGYWPNLVRMHSWPCGKCGSRVESSGGYDASCDQCNAQYNAFGQRLRDDWRGNSSNWNEDVDDLEGFERQQLSHEEREYHEAWLAGGGPY